MTIAANKSRIRRIAIAVLIMTFASWSQDGLVICYGADGHVEIERPSNKDCCKSQEKRAPITLLGQAQFVHCTDIPLGAQKYLASAGHTVSVPHHALILGIVSPLAYSRNQSGPAVSIQDIPPPHNPLLAVLKTVVLLI